MIRIAIIGCGRIARIHLKTIINCEKQCRLTAVVDANKARAEDYAREYGCDNVFDDISCAAASDKFDAAIICLPHHLLAGSAQIMLANNKHVLAEKPCGINAAEYQEAMMTAKNAGLTLLPAYVRRFMAEEKMFLKTLKSGELGEIHNIAFTMYSSTLKSEIATPWWAKADLAGGFWVPVFGSHRLDEILTLFGRMPETIYASYQSNHKHIVEGETDGAIIMRFDNNLMCMLSFISFTNETTETLPFGSKIIIGSCGTLQAVNGKIYLNGEEVPLPETGDAFEAQLLHFCEVVEGAPPSVVTATDGCNVLRVMDAARLSDTENRVIKLDINK